MIGQILNWFRTHQLLAALLVVGLLVPLGVTVGGIPIAETLFGKDGAHQGNDQANSSVQVEPPKPSWHLNTYNANKAILIESPSDPNLRRVEVTQADTKGWWDIRLHHKPVRVVGEELYSLRLRARAEDVRSMGMAVTQAHGSGRILGLYRDVPLMRQWQDYEWEFLATEDEANAQVAFFMGGWKVPVEITAIRLLKLSDKQLRWNLYFREGSEAGLMRIPEFPLGTRVAIAKTFNNTPKHIQLIQQGVMLQLNTRYRLRFHARADQPRDMYVAVSQVEYPWNGLGLKQQISLTSEWQFFDLEFVAKSTDRNARLVFDLGGSPIPVDINAVLLQGDSKMVIPSGDPSGSPLSRSPVGSRSIELG